MFPELDEKQLKVLANAALLFPKKQLSIKLVLSHPVALKLFETQKQAFIQRLAEKDKIPLFDNQTVATDYLSKQTARYRTKNPAMFDAIIDYCGVLNDPHIACVLLTRLSNELTKEILLAGKLSAFKNASTKYTYEIIGTNRYPIPSQHYRKINKDGLLTQLLLKILQTADMGHRSTKWFGFIPTSDANESIKQGHLFVESQFGIGTLHGKYSHMIQWVMLIYAVEMGYIKLPNGITPKSIIQALVTEKTDDRSSYLWQLVLDRLITSHYSFCDPYRLTGLISTGFFGDKCATLEVYLRDSFCDSFLQLVKSHQNTHRENTSPTDFAKAFSMVNLNEFITAEYFVAANQSRHKKKLKQENTHHTDTIKFFSTTAVENEAMIIVKNHRPRSS